MSKFSLRLSSIVMGLSILACVALNPARRADPSPTPIITLRPPPTSEGSQAFLDRWEARPCPQGDFSCVTMSVPLNHFDPADQRTIDVVFAVLPASGERKGMFVTVVGGPGGSGLAVADSYTAAFDASIPESFDVVFFDQRGVAASEGLQCIEAAAAYYQTVADPTTPAGETAMAEGAQRFARECIGEMGREDLLPYLGTEQAIEDLEVFRQAIGDDRFWLYGESYGTQFVQTYAAKYSDRLAGLILDGPVDLELTGFEYYSEQTMAFNDVLAMMLQSCDQSVSCADDMGGAASAAYDALAARLADAPLPFDFPLPSGGVDSRELTLGDLQIATVGYAYSETARMIFLRALAAASAHDDFVPLARILYDTLSLDPETLSPVIDPSWSDAAYYAVECNDYDFGPAEEYLRAGDAMDASASRLASLFYGDLPCAFWPEDGYDPGRPAALVAAGIPTLVMVGTADPATPIANARRIVSHLADGYLVVENGGPHVIFGWGNACVDDLVAEFLVQDILPDRETTCEGVVIGDYVPLPRADAEDFSNALEALAAVDTEIYYLPEYYYWDLETPTSVGCPYGGTFAFEASAAGEALTLSDCSFSRGLILRGSGEIDYDAGTFRLAVSVEGIHQGDLVYLREGDGSLRVTGEYDGSTIDLSP